MYSNIFHKIDTFVTNTSAIIYIRNDDSLLIIRPDKIQHLNKTSFEMLYSLYREKAGAEKTVQMVHEKYGVKKDIIIKTLSEIVKSLSATMKEECKGLEKIPILDSNPDNIKFPILSEIALTYKCQNKCDFCSSLSPYIRNDFNEMTTQQVKFIIDRIFDEARVPTISFIGGEPTMRIDLPELIEHAVKKGIRTNLNTNGIKCSDKELVMKLSTAGLHSAQVRLESHDEMIHNRITGNMESFKKTIKGIHLLKKAGILTCTNTTINRWNRDHLIPLAKFIKDEFNSKYLSLSIIITSENSSDQNNIQIEYSSILSILEPVLKFCDKSGIKLIWNSPTPYCIFNPIEHNLGSKVYACVSELLSINSRGDLIPCSNYNRGIGNLLKNSFEHIWNSKEALYFRRWRYIPPVCKKCGMKNLCKGAFPLYRGNFGSFKEIEKINKKRPLIGNLLWSIENRLNYKQLI